MKRWARVGLIGGVALAPCAALAGPPTLPSTEAANRFEPAAQPETPAITAEAPLVVELSGLERAEVEVWTCAARRDTCLASDGILESLTVWRAGRSDSGETDGVRITVPHTGRNGVLDLVAPPGSGATFELSPKAGQTVWARARTATPRDRVFVDERSARAVHDALAADEPAPDSLPVADLSADPLARDLALFDGLRDWLVANGEDPAAAEALAQAAAAHRLDLERDGQSTGFRRRRRRAFDQRLDAVSVSGPEGSTSRYLALSGEASITVHGPAVVDLRLRALPREHHQQAEASTVHLSAPHGVDETLELSPTVAEGRQATVRDKTMAVGLLERHRVVVPPGKHTIAVEANAPILAAATVRARVYRLGEALSGKAAPAKLSKAKRRGKTPLGQAWAARLGWREAPEAPDDDLSRLIALSLGTDPAHLATIVELAADIDPATLDERVSHGLASRWAALAHHRSVEAGTRVETAQAIARFDPAGAVPTGLMARAEAVAVARRAKRSRALSLAMATAQRAPDDPALRRRALRVFWRGSQWATLAVAPDVQAQTEPRIERLMVRRPDEAMAVERPQPPSRRDLWAIPVDGTPFHIDAPTSPVFPNRPAAVTLRLHFGSPDTHDGRFSLTVDGETKHGLALADYERIVLALAPGDHELALTAPGITAFTNVAPVRDGQPSPSDGRMESAASLAPDQSVTYALPPGGPGLARLAIRLPAAGTAALDVTLEGAGVEPRSHRVEVDIEGRDANVFPLSPEFEPTARRTVVVPIEGAHSHLRVRVLEGSALVSVAVRRDVTAPAQDIAEAGEDVGLTSATSPSSSSSHSANREPALDAIARLSTVLRDDPDDTAARIERGHRLVDLEQYGLAREDLARALAQNPTLEADTRALALAARIEERNDPRHIDVPLPESGVQFIAPAFLGLDHVPSDLEPLLAVAEAARSLGPAAGLAGMDRDPGVLPAALQAELAARAEQPRMAARTRLEAYGDSQHWPLAYAAARDYLAVLALDDGYRDAGVAYGLASQLGAESDTGRLRNLRLDAGRLSAWKRVSAARDSAGFERIIESKPTAPGESQALGLALLTTVWADDEATYLWPGRRRVVREQLSGDEALSLQAHCQVLRPVSRVDDTVTMRLRVDDEVRELDVVPSRPDALFQTIDVGLTSGRHRVELELPESEQGVRCSVRAQQDGKTLVSERTRRWLTAKPNRPFEVDIGGPVTVRVSVRRFGHDPKRAAPLDARIELLPLDDRGQATTNASLTREVRLPEGADDVARAERSRPGAVGPIVEDTFLVAGTGPARLRVSVPEDAALVRVSLRQADTRAAAADAPPSIAAADLAGSDPGRAGDEAFGVPPAPLRAIRASDVEPRHTRFGTVTSDNRVGFDEIGDADLFVPRVTSTHHLDYRRELARNRLWLRIGPTARVRQTSATAGGGRLSVRANFPVSRLRLGLTGEVLAQPYEGAAAYSVRGSAFLDRPTQLAPRLELRPALYFDARTQSLDPGTVTDEQPQPRVYLRFVDDHPFVLRPELSLRYAPLQDLLLAVTAQTPLNSDFGSLDRFDAQADLWAVASNLRRVLPEFSVGYQASVRLADEHRSQTYLRHRFTASLGMGVWAKQAARISLGLRNALFFAEPFGLRNVASFYLRLDFAFGRGLRDYGPREMLFRPLKEQRDFAPTMPEVAQR